MFKGLAVTCMCRALGGVLQSGNLLKGQITPNAQCQHFSQVVAEACHHVKQSIPFLGAYRVFCRIMPSTFRPFRRFSVREDRLTLVPALQIERPIPRTNGEEG